MIARSFSIPSNKRRNLSRDFRPHGPLGGFQIVIRRHLVISVSRPNVLASSIWWSWGKKRTPYLDIVVKQLGHFPETNTAAGETCFSIPGRKCFWKECARNYDSPQNIVEKPRAANSRNSNFLRNVPPNKQGKIDEAAVKVLEGVGKLRGQGE